ncbi:hypothetical protein ACHAWF_013343 [Thalassiosira exigua]
MTSPSTGEQQSRTTVLSPGTVESRNATNRTQISAEIQAFLDGSDGNGASQGLASEFRTFFTIWMFLTRIPGPSWVDLHPGFLMRGMSYFPVVGSILGLIMCTIFDFCHESLGLPATIAASFAILHGLYITGCFHEDGLADSCDGIGGGWSKSQVLKIMTDSRVGTFGCAALCMFLYTKLELLGSLGASTWALGTCSGAGPAIITSQTLARLSAPYLIRTKDYVAEVGPKSPFYIFMVEAKHLVSWGRVFFASLHSFGLGALLYGPRFSAGLVLSVLSVAHFFGRKGDYLLGGVMGDFLGGTICICEIVLLTIILSKDSVMELASTVGCSEIFQQMSELYHDGRIYPVVNFALLVFALTAWNAFVGGPDMYDRELEDNNSNGSKKKA